MRVLERQRHVIQSKIEVSGVIGSRRSLHIWTIGRRDSIPIDAAKLGIGVACPQVVDQRVKRLDIAEL